MTKATRIPSPIIIEITEDEAEHLHAVIGEMYTEAPLTNLFNALEAIGVGGKYDAFIERYESDDEFTINTKAAA
jgi:hypothetical protein